MWHMQEIARKRISDSVLERIREMLESGELKDGDKLPNQIDFAAQLGISRASLREALHMLMVMGVVEQRPGAGTIIRNKTSAMFLDQFSLPLLSDAKGTMELVQAREVLEIAAIEIAVRNITDKEIQTLADSLEEMRRAVKQAWVDNYIEKDFNFHYQIVQSTHNRFMIHFYLAVGRQMQEFLKESFTVLPGMFETSLLGHQEIFDALRLRNVSRAGKAMKKHLRYVSQFMDRYYQVVLGKSSTIAKDLR